MDKRFEKQQKLGLPKYTLLEEIFNSITHGVGTILAVSAIVLLPIFAHKDGLTITTVSIYGVALFIMYIVSTIYHGLAINKAKKIFRIIDHCAVFFLIAGTYTPISLAIIGGTPGWILFCIVWIAAILGVLLNILDMKKYSKLSTVCCLVMGWCVLFAMKPLIANVSTKEIILIFSGGIAYSIGAIIYGAGKNIKYMHTLWHIFVLAGSVFHFFFIFDCVKV